MEGCMLFYSRVDVPLYVHSMTCAHVCVGVCSPRLTGRPVCWRIGREESTGHRRRRRRRRKRRRKRREENTEAGGARGRPALSGKRERRRTNRRREEMSRSEPQDEVGGACASVHTWWSGGRPRPKRKKKAVSVLQTYVQ